MACNTWRMGASRVYTPVSNETDECNRQGLQVPKISPEIRNPECGATLRDGLYPRGGRMESLAEVVRMRHVGLRADRLVHM